MSEASLKDVALPVDSFKSAAPHLRRPFTPEAVRWKVQTGTLVVPHVDSRLVTERLNLVCPDLWHDEYETFGQGLLCRLTVDGITRLDVGEKYTGKGLFSDAFKRAAVKFGVAVSLYALPKVFLSFEEGHLKEVGKQKKSTVITEEGRKRLDSGYRAWLKGTGEKQFGPALDHGDVEGAIGDPEAEATAATSDTPAEAEQPQKLDSDAAAALIQRAEQLYASLAKPAKKGIETKAAFNRALAGVWHDMEKLSAFVDDLQKRGEG
jgi:hypothetical protein